MPYLNDSLAGSVASVIKITGKIRVVVVVVVDTTTVVVVVVVVANEETATPIAGRCMWVLDGQRNGQFGHQLVHLLHVATIIVVVIIIGAHQIHQSLALILAWSPAAHDATAVEDGRGIGVSHSSTTTASCTCLDQVGRLVLVIVAVVVHLILLQLGQLHLVVLQLLQISLVLDVVIIIYIVIIIIMVIVVVAIVHLLLAVRRGQSLPGQRIDEERVLLQILLQRILLGQDSSGVRRDVVVGDLETAHQVADQLLLLLLVLQGCGRRGRGRRGPLTLAIHVIIIIHGHCLGLVVRHIHLTVAAVMVALRQCLATTAR